MFAARIVISYLDLSGKRLTYNLLTHIMAAVSVLFPNNGKPKIHKFN